MREASNGDVGEHDGLVFARDFDVVILAARAGAERREVEPDALRSGVRRGCGGLRSRSTPAVSAVVVGELVEKRLEASRRVGRAGEQVGAGLREFAQAVVGAAVDIEHVACVLEELDGGKKALALQAVLCRGLRGGTFEVATSVTPRLKRPAKRPPRIMASAMSVTKSSSKHNTRASRAMCCGDELER